MTVTKTKRRTKIDMVLDALQVAIIEREEDAKKPDAKKYINSAKDGLLEAMRIVENIKEYGHTMTSDAEK